MLICPHSRPSALSIDQLEPSQIMMQVTQLPDSVFVILESWFGRKACRSKSDSHNIIRTWVPPKKRSTYQSMYSSIATELRHALNAQSQIQDSRLMVLTLSTPEIEPGDEDCASNKRSSIRVPSNNGRVLNAQGETPSWTASCPTWHTSAGESMFGSCATVQKTTDRFNLRWILI